MLNLKAGIKATRASIDLAIRYRAWKIATRGTLLDSVKRENLTGEMRRLQHADGCMGMIDEICHRCETKHLRDKVGQCLITYRSLTHFDPSMLPATVEKEAV
jgi:hypothetical protein